MEAMIDSGEEWMIPLLDYRDFLVSTQDPTVKAQQREYKGRDGSIKITETGALRYRTYTLDFSKTMLRRLLATQRQIQEEYDPEFVLIAENELREIRRLWITERQDWDDALPQIFSEVMGQSLQWDQNDVYTPGRLESETLRAMSQEYDIPLQMIQKLIDAEWQHYGMRRRARVHKTIAKVFNEDWRTLEEVQTEVTRRQERVDARVPA